MFTFGWIGFIRASRKLSIVIFLWFIMLVFSGFFAWQIGEAIENHAGRSLRYQRLAGGFDLTWYEEFRDQATGVARSFGPTVTHAGPILDVLEMWLEGDYTRFSGPITLAFIGFMLIWTFFHGGVIEFMQERPVSARWSGFFTACGLHFGKILMINLIHLIYLWWVYRWFSTRLFDRIEALTRNEIVEWHVMIFFGLGYLIVFGLLVLGLFVFELARILSVLRGRMNPISSLYHALQLMIRVPGKIIGIAILYGGLSALLMLLFALLNPGTGPGSWKGLLLFIALTQIYLVIRWWIRVGWTGALVALAESYGYRRPGAF